MNENTKILCVIFCFILFIASLFSCQELDLEYGGRVGRDTRYVVGNGMVQISHVNGKDMLEMYHNATLSYTLLDSVTSYKSKGNNLYVISDEGYGVVDKETYKCKLLIFNPEEYFKAGYERHSNGKIYTLSPNEAGKKSADKIAFYGYAKLNDPNIVFLDSFDSFNENEQKMLLKLCEKDSFDKSLLGKSIEITIEEDCVVNAEYLKKVQANEKVDVVFMDPPRAGSDIPFLKSIATLKPKKVVYVSCNVETQARDLAFLCKNGYKVGRIQPVDMFPHTNHVECIAELIRK